MRTFTGSGSWETELERRGRGVRRDTRRSRAWFGSEQFRGDDDPDDEHAEGDGQEVEVSVDEAADGRAEEPEHQGDGEEQDGAADDRGKDEGVEGDLEESGRDGVELVGVNGDGAAGEDPGVAGPVAEGVELGLAEEPEGEAVEEVADEVAAEAAEDGGGGGDGGVVPRAGAALEGEGDLEDEGGDGEEDGFAETEEGEGEDGVAAVGEGEHIGR